MDDKYKEFSIATIFRNSGLLTLNDRLYDKGIGIYRQLDDITEDDFWKLVGRTSDQNREKIRDILQSFPPAFRRQLKFG
jgi:hypothetical protein